jgi:hypothetical protein
VDDLVTADGRRLGWLAAVVVAVRYASDQWSNPPRFSQKSDQRVLVPSISAIVPQRLPCSDCPATAEPAVAPQQRQCSTMRPNLPDRSQYVRRKVSEALCAHPRPQIAGHEMRVRIIPLGKARRSAQARTGLVRVTPPPGVAIDSRQPADILAAMA